MVEIIKNNGILNCLQCPEYSSDDSYLMDTDVKLGKECQDYRTSDGIDRRRDQNQIISSSIINDFNTLSPSLWYRIAGLSGNQVLTECPRHSKHPCNSKYPVWINGTMPSVAQGKVVRTACVRHYFDMDLCCHWRSSVTIRNCGGYFVYQFSDVIYGTICTDYSKYAVDKY